MNANVTVPIVVDANVLVPTVYSKLNINRFLLSGNLILIWNDQTRDEALEVANRLWAKRYSKTYDINYFTEVVMALDLLTRERGIRIGNMPEDWERTSPDRDDDVYLFAAAAGNAEYIVTHDKADLLNLREFRGIPIGTASELFQWLKITHPLAGSEG